jgi:hypothetical protein
MSKDSFPAGVSVLAKRRTHDNKTILLWADGQITQSFGIWLPGIAPRKHTTGKLPLADAWVVMDEVCLWDMSEVAFLIKAARVIRSGTIHKIPLSPGTLRSLAAKLSNKHQEKLYAKP